MISTHEKIEGFVYNNRCIDGSVAGCSKCVGYCNFIEHPGFLTVKLRQEHNCIKKGCNYYSAKEKKQKDKHINQEDCTSNILDFAQQKTASIDGLRIIRAKNYPINNCILYFITITNEYSFNVLEYDLKQYFKCNVYFERLNYDFDTCVKIIMAKS